MLVEREVGDETLQPGMLVFERPQLAPLADAQMGKLLLPDVEGGFADAELSADVGRRRAVLDLAKRVGDHDRLFEAHRWKANLRILEIDEIKTVPHVPLSHPFVERLVGTMRREFLDHMLFWNARDLDRKLAEFQMYYNAARGHASLGGRTPLTCVSKHAIPPADLNHVRWVSHCRGLVQLPVAA